MLGSDIAVLAETLGYTVNIYDLPEFDLTAHHNIESMVADNDIIINCAAYTAVDQAESEEEICRSVNADAVGFLGKTANLANKYVLHISTDFVFGDDGDCALNENSATYPLSVYGATKLQGETLLHDSECRNGIIRVQWTYGLNGQHFISKIAELANKLDSLKVVDDQYGAPTPTSSVAEAVMFFVKNEIEGLYHYAAKGYASRYEVAELIVSQLALPTLLTSCSSADFPAPAARPFNSRFDCSKIDRELDFERPDWREALKIFLRNSLK